MRGNETKICIVGGGASGMAAAAAACMENPGVLVCIVEKKGKLGSKLLATGNGRCNFTNTACSSSVEVLDFFRRLGVKAREEEQGRVYPYSGRSEDVLAAFESYLSSHGVETALDFAVERISVNSRGGFAVSGGQREITAGKVLIATGGKAGPQFGCSGDGYRLARGLGHTATTLAPALAPVECEGDFEKLKGTRAKAAVSLLKKGEVLETEKGEVQFAEYGLSGVCVFNLSRHIRLLGCGFSDYELAVDFMPEVSKDETVFELRYRRDRLGLPLSNMLVSLVPGSVAGYMLEKAGIDGAGCEASDAQIESVAGSLKNSKFTVSGVKGWRFAQCTSGGIPTSEINMSTMESKIAKGLYFAGEAIDYDGPCGGFNLNNAWETGIKAGRAMARDVQNP
ncbi:MAG: aminoacetone oxidase family FAD-binding enzyme [Clostridiales bacterium]|nr:aminoacetone oxidase family FAD-binding enzyme [Clostridiales bacterium]